MVCKTVLLEFEWVMRDFYRFSSLDTRQVFQHLPSLPMLYIMLVIIQCESMATFDDKKFARRLNRLALMSGVIVLK